MRRMINVLRAVTMAAVLLALTASVVDAAPTGAPLKGEGKNLKIVANLDTGSGTEMEVATIKGREYAYPRYQFSNRSQDIKDLFTGTCDLLGIERRVIDVGQLG